MRKLSPNFKVTIPKIYLDTNNPYKFYHPTAPPPNKKHARIFRWTYEFGQHPRPAWNFVELMGPRNNRLLAIKTSTSVPCLFTWQPEANAHARWMLAPSRGGLMMKFFDLVQRLKVLEGEGSSQVKARIQSDRWPKTPDQAKTGEGHLFQFCWSKDAGKDTFLQQNLWILVRVGNQ